MEVVFENLGQFTPQTIPDLAKILPTILMTSTPALLSATLAQAGATMGYEHQTGSKWDLGQAQVSGEFFRSLRHY